MPSIRTGAATWTRGFGLHNLAGRWCVARAVAGARPVGRRLIGGGYRGAGFDVGGATLADSGKTFQTFLARYSVAGDATMGTSFPSTGKVATLMSVDVAPSGDVLIGGVFEQSIQIGPDTLADPMTALPVTKKSQGEASPAFVARLADRRAAVVKFAGEEGSSGVVRKQRAVIASLADATGNVSVTGCFSGALDSAAASSRHRSRSRRTTSAPCSSPRSIRTATT